MDDSYENLKNSEPKNRSIVITGGAGFIGSHLYHHWKRKYPGDEIVVIDRLTTVSDRGRIPLAPLLQVDLAQLHRDDSNTAELARQKLRLADIVFHCAAESHVDVSLSNPFLHVQSNVVATANVLEELKVAQKHSIKRKAPRLIHMSTDEVYGELTHDEAKWTESSPLMPRTPYACTKAAADMLVQVYQGCYGIDAIIVRPSNNFGTNQYFEKLIPRTIARINNGLSAQLNKGGNQIRDWLWVEDHCRALELIALAPAPKHRIYNISGNDERTVKSVVYNIVRICTESYGVQPWVDEVALRPVDDFRYAMSNDRIRHEFGWEPAPSRFHSRLADCVKHYWQKAKSPLRESTR